MEIENLDATIKGIYFRKQTEFIRNLVFKIKKKEFIKVQSS
jgi:hypothetical protein